MVLEPASVCASVCSHFHKSSSLKLLGHSKPSSLCEASIERGNQCVYLNNPGHMTKMAAMPIYDKNPSKLFSETCGHLA